MKDKYDSSNSSYFYWAMVLILLFMLFMLFFTFAIQYRYKDVEAINLLSGISAFIIAVLTFFYVITTNRQLSVMTLQLQEIKKERELRNQPVPFISSIKFQIDKPCLFYNPHDKSLEYISRYMILFSLRNIGNFPAIDIDVTSILLIPDTNDNDIYNATSRKIEVLKENDRYPVDDSLEDDFLFPED